MKNRFLLSMAIFSVLMVAGVGCTTMQEATDSYEDERSTYRSSAFNDPFSNNFGNQVLVRDAYTGRLFYVYPSNSFSSPFDAYRFDNRYYNNRSYNNRYGSRPSTSRPQLSDEQIREQREKAEDSRRKILGGKN
jgi:hypothetical protein